MASRSLAQPDWNDGAGCAAARSASESESASEANARNNAAGVRMAFGSDLLGQLQPDQSKEFAIRSQVLSPLEILRSATVVGAELLGRTGELGVVAPGALADLLVVDGNPLRDLALLQGQGEHLSLIMKAGALYRNRLPVA